MNYFIYVKDIISPNDVRTCIPYSHVFHHEKNLIIVEIGCVCLQYEYTLHTGKNSRVGKVPYSPCCSVYCYCTYVSRGI